jgi:response regulator RpfG family c-di-GMP phosphodiesterase
MNTGLSTIHGAPLDGQPTGTATRDALPRRAADPSDHDKPSLVRVSIVEDNDRVRESLTSLINGAPGFRCVGAHRSAEAAIKLVPEEKPDVVLMDIHLP